MTGWPVNLARLDTWRSWQTSKYYPGSTINLRSCGSCPSHVSQRFHKWWLRLILQPYWRHSPIQTLSKSFLRQVERHSWQRITKSQGHRTVTQKNGIQILNPDIKTAHFLTCYTSGGHQARYLHASMKTEMPKMFFNPDASLVAYRYSPGDYWAVENKTRRCNTDDMKTRHWPRTYIMCTSTTYFNFNVILHLSSFSKWPLSPPFSHLNILCIHSPPSNPKYLSGPSQPSSFQCLYTTTWRIFNNSVMQLPILRYRLDPFYVLYKHI